MLGVEESSEFLEANFWRSELFLDDGPSGIVGRLCRISAWRTCAGFFFLCNFTVGVRLAIGLRTNAFSGEPFSSEVSSGASFSVTPFSNKPFSGEDISSTGVIGECASSCFLSDSKCSGVEIFTVFFSFFFTIERGAGTVSGGNDSWLGVTYGRLSGSGSSMDVNNRTPAWLPAEYDGVWKSLSSS